MRRPSTRKHTPEPTGGPLSSLASRYYLPPCPRTARSLHRVFDRVLWDPPHAVTMRLVGPPLWCPRCHGPIRATRPPNLAAPGRDHLKSRAEKLFGPSNIHVLIAGGYVMYVPAACASEARRCSVATLRLAKKGSPRNVNRPSRGLAETDERRQTVRQMGVTWGPSSLHPAEMNRGAVARDREGIGSLRFLGSLPALTLPWWAPDDCPARSPARSAPTGNVLTKSEAAR